MPNWNYSNYGNHYKLAPDIKHDKSFTPMQLPQRTIHLFNSKSITTYQPCQWFLWGCQAIEWDTCLLAMLLDMRYAALGQQWTVLGLVTPNRSKWSKVSLQVCLTGSCSTPLRTTSCHVNVRQINTHQISHVTIQHKHNLVSLWEAQKGRRSQDLRLPSQLLPALPICLHPRGHMTCGWQCCDAGHLESQRSPWTGQVEMNCTCKIVQLLSMRELPIYVCVNVYIHIYIFIYLCVYVYIYICVCVYVYIYISLFIESLTLI